jgi:chemotaxis protein methyltransferase CheR
MAYPVQHEFKFTNADFAFIAATIGERTGITLGSHKRDLVYGRLARRLRALDLENFRQYCELLKGPEGGAEIGLLVNAITTNMTSFFRESHHFDHLRDFLVARMAERSGGSRSRLRVWSAGCSSGEEPYSIAMTLREACNDRLPGWDAKILATDIDTNVLATAEQGVYPADRVTPVPLAYRSRYIAPGADRTFAVADSLRQLISFKPLNLLEEWPMTGPFDVIFCRNVVIYFDKPTQRLLFDRFADMLGPGGLLYVGHSESLFRVCDRFAAAGRTVYRKIA